MKNSTRYGLAALAALLLAAHPAAADNEAVVKFVAVADSTNGNTAQVDSLSNSLVGISFDHHEIHEGNHYFWEETTTLGDGATWDIAFKTANSTKWTHIVFVIATSLGSTVELYEGDTITWDGTVEPAYNNNRNSANTSDWQEFETDPAIGGAGTLLAQATLGTSTNPAQGLPGSGSRSRELIGKQDEEYRLRVTSNNNANEITVLLEWYEHVNSN